MSVSSLDHTPPRPDYVGMQDILASFTQKTRQPPALHESGAGNPHNSRTVGRRSMVPAS